METALTAWADATAPVDVSNVQKNRLLYTSVCENVALARTYGQNSGTKDEDDERYHCRPWDHAHFLARVRSFCTSWWFAKPREIISLECARHGWSNSGPDELQCSCCKQFLCFRLDSKLSAKGVLTVVQTFAGQLVTGHTELCPWRGNPSPESFMTLPIATKRQVFEAFMDRMRIETTKMQSDATFEKRMVSVSIADTITSRISSEMSGDEDIVVDLNGSVWASNLVAKLDRQDNGLVDTKAFVNAALLIVCGWKFDEKDGAKADMLVCSFCERQWSAFAKTTSGEDVGDGEPPAKRFRTDVDCSVDLLSQHRHFCPWIVERKSTDVNDFYGIDAQFVKLPGWKQYAQALVFLGKSDDNVTKVTDASDASEKRAIDPVQALATVQALLGV
ncbi:unnamed protein product [Hyaloperonospora brassicae]|uniref:C3HC-type domain-containing protein n=1 Tax=Hyaloperonospora brassicae TaxID=162125 RepID=A0AAV0UUA6_HYABA|nr:unnamed protein product [Hyaloperonospora brassicae]